MIDSALKFASTSTFTMFHADATFKLSDIGYPTMSVILTTLSLGFIRVQLSVSRRTYQQKRASLRPKLSNGLCVEPIDWEFRTKNVLVV
ncbi:hypothetical protein PR002_g8192 [Phytophthora rubi]|uniref:Uncharacterized protein n=1 Tax=Phytophthora rubi TaxID=129364 RepID=A0A6A3MTB5_9STRA|nr:hypothetical protein PR002_g8192 [Phytophthora rubi]